MKTNLGEPSSSTLNVVVCPKVLCVPACVADVSQIRLKYAI